MTFNPCPKPSPRLLAKRERASDLARIDKAESAKVRVRSGGRCEMVELFPNFIGRLSAELRCTHRAALGNHHLRSGSGRRNRGTSILAEYRLAVCLLHHEEITGHVLQPLGTVAEREAAATVIYQRVGGTR